MYPVLEGYVTSDGKYYKNKDVAEQKEIMLEIEKNLDDSPLLFPGFHIAVRRILGHLEENYTLVRKPK
jgi:hypothetical protein